VSYKSVFSRQVESLGNTGDVLVALSTSGNSKNVIEAVKLAASMKMNSIIMTGESGGLLSGMGNVVIKIPSNDTQRIQEGHILVGHIICELLEQHVMDNSD